MLSVEREIPTGSLPPAQRPRSQWLAALVGAVGGGGGALVVMLGLWPVIRPLVDQAHTLLLAALAMGAAVLAIVAHEVGHVVGGWAAGFRFMLLIVGPVRVDRIEGRLRVGLNRDLAMAGGVALSVPPDREHLSRRFALTLGAGPVTSLVLGVVAVIASAGLSGEGWASVHAKLALGVFGFISLMLGLITLIPLPMGDMASDGLRLLRLLRGGPPARRDAATLLVVGQATLGQRPRDWDRDAVIAALYPPDGSSAEVAARYFAMLYAMDRDDAAERRLHVDRLFEIHTAAGKPLQAAALVELLVAAAVGRDHSRVGELLPRIKQLHRYASPTSRLLIEAVAAQVAGDSGAALVKLEEARTKTASLQAYQVELFGRLEAVFREGLTAGRTPSG